MTAYAPTAAAPRPQLALAALIALVLHALLLLGLSHGARTVPVTGGPPVFQFRTIAPESSPSATAAAPAETTPQPRQPRPKPHQAPPPRPDSPPAIDRPHSGTGAPGSGLPLPVVTVAAAPPPAAPAEAAGTASLLQGPPLAAFGGKDLPSPIAPPLPPEQVPVAMRQAAQSDPASSTAPGTPDAIPPVQLPRPADMTYQATVTQNGRQVTLPSTVAWRHDGQYYDLRWTLYGPAIGDRSRYAAGLVTARGLAPVTARAMGPDGYALTFDYAQARLRNGPSQPAPASGDGPPFPASEQSAGLPLPPGAQDPFSVLIQLGALIAGDPARYPVGSRIALPVISGAGQTVQPLDFVVVDDNDFSLAGQFASQRSPALHLAHEPASDHDARIELWLGKRLDYLPIRLLLTPATGGDRLDMTLQSAYAQTVPPSAPSASAASESGVSGDSGAR